jgi:hypothetical protein
VSEPVFEAFRAADKLRVDLIAKIVQRLTDFTERDGKDGESSTLIAIAQALGAGIDGAEKCRSALSLITSSSGKILPLFSSVEAVLEKLAHLSPDDMLRAMITRMHGVIRECVQSLGIDKKFKNLEGDIGEFVARKKVKGDEEMSEVAHDVISADTSPGALESFYAPDLGEASSLQVNPLELEGENDIALDRQSGATPAVTALPWQAEGNPTKLVTDGLETVVSTATSLKKALDGASNKLTAIISAFDHERQQLLRFGDKYVKLVGPDFSNTVTQYGHVLESPVKELKGSIDAMLVAVTQFTDGAIAAARTLPAKAPRQRQGIRDKRRRAR